MSKTDYTKYFYRASLTIYLCFVFQPTGGANPGASNPPNIPRPSEVFYNKLTPALKEKVFQIKFFIL